MQKLIFVICLAIGITMPLATSGQGVLQISTLEETTTGDVSIASDSWVGQRFLFLPGSINAYKLDRVELLMDATSGVPSSFGVYIYAGNNVPGDGPQTMLEMLTGAMDPTSSGVYSYASSGITLSSANDYYLVVSAGSPLATGSYTWNSTVPALFQNDRWRIQNGQSISANGLNWTPVSRERTLQMAIYATPVPEPSTGALAVLGLVGLMIVRRRQ